MNSSPIAAMLGASALLMVIACNPATAGGLEVEEEQLRVDVFGIKTGASVSNGFVFVDGVYLECPYTVSQRGLGIFVNDTMIFDLIEAWPPRDVYVPEPPGYPPGLTAESTFANIRDDFADPYDSPAHREYRYAHQHFPSEEAHQHIKEWYEGLPFVSSVQTTNGGSVLHVVTLAGEEEFISIYVSGSPFGVIKTLTKEVVLEDLEGIRARFERRIAKGDCFFLMSSSRELSFGRGRTKKILPDIIDTLRSDAEPGVKVQRLKAIGLLPPTWTQQGLEIVDAFRSTPQLEARIRELRGGVGEDDDAADVPLGAAED